MGPLRLKPFVWIAALHGGVSLAWHALLHAPESPAVIWPAAGISLGLLLVFGRQYWSAVSLGALLSYVLEPAWGLPAALGLALVAGLSGWLAVWLIERVGRVRLTLPSVRDMVLLGVGGIIIAPLSSALGWSVILDLARAGNEPGTGGIASAWMSEALGTLTFTPLVVAWANVRQALRRSSLERTAFAGCSIVAVALLSLTTLGFRGTFTLVALLVVGLVLWSAERFGLRTTTVLNAALVFATVVGFSTGEGVFAPSLTRGTVWAPQLFSAGLIIISLVFAALARERDLLVEQLRASETRLMSVINSSPDQIALLAVEEKQVRALETGNLALFAGLRSLAPGLQAEELLGRRGPEVAARIAESLQSLLPLRKAIRDTIAASHPTHSTHELETPWGTRVIEATTVPVRNDAGVITHVLWQSRDVTARVQAERSLRASEARWRSLIEAAPHFVTLVDRDWKLLFSNRMAEGFKSEEVIGTPLDHFLVDDESRAVSRENLTAVFERGETRSYEVQAVGPNGTVAWYRCDAAPVWDQGRVVAAMLLASDVTDQRFAEARRRQLELQLYQAQKMESLGTLAGGIAHDFNNVLAGIMANAELLKQVVEHDQEASDSIRDILAAGKRARDVVRQILAFSRRQPMEQSVVKVSDVILEAMSLLRASLPSGIRLRTTVRPGQVCVLADETQLHQVIMNLGTNAAQAIGESEGEIAFEASAIVVRPRDELTQPVGGRPPLTPGHYARIIVRDDGCGMNATTLARIFDPFFTTKPVGQGTGLGLSVVHGIVTGYHGTIVAESVPGHGTTMTVYLPLYREEDAALPATAPAAATA